MSQRRSARVTEIEAREALAAMMIRQSIATGHGDTFQDLLDELEAWIILTNPFRLDRLKRKSDNRQHKLNLEVKIK